MPGVIRQKKKKSAIPVIWTLIIQEKIKGGQNFRLDMEKVKRARSDY